MKMGRKPEYPEKKPLTTSFRRLQSKSAPARGPLLFISLFDMDGLHKGVLIDRTPLRNRWAPQGRQDLQALFGTRWTKHRQFRAQGRRSREQPAKLSADPAR